MSSFQKGVKTIFKSPLKIPFSEGSQNKFERVNPPENVSIPHNLSNQSTDSPGGLSMTVG